MAAVRLDLFFGENKTKEKGEDNAAVNTSFSDTRLQTTEEQRWWESTEKVLESCQWLTFTVPSSAVERP